MLYGRVVIIPINYSTRHSFRIKITETVMVSRSIYLIYIDSSIETGNTIASISSFFRNALFKVCKYVARSSARSFAVRFVRLEGSG